MAHEISDERQQHLAIDGNTGKMNEPQILFIVNGRPDNRLLVCNERVHSFHHLHELVSLCAVLMVALCSMLHSLINDIPDVEAVSMKSPIEDSSKNWEELLSDNDPDLRVG